MPHLVCACRICGFYLTGVCAGELSAAYLTDSTNQMCIIADCDLLLYLSYPHSGDERTRAYELAECRVSETRRQPKVFMPLDST
jgi:hypothetical protein